MRIIVGERGSGKTTELINIAHETDQYIVTPTRRMADQTFKMAREIGKPIRNPISVGEALRSPLDRSMYGHHHKPAGALVDEAAAVLEMILHTGTIHAMTLTGTMPLVLGGPRTPQTEDLTVARETCEMRLAYEEEDGDGVIWPDHYECSECHAKVNGIQLYCDTEIPPKFCPSCGRRVTGTGRKDS